ncbi:MAG TPA: serine hydrolase domain-containing protein, partial [Steroidobacteraceae bacterium]|nr:serine hydrolase domain-containing protein [Steroidobacteraceae bacterium]
MTTPRRAARSASIFLLLLCAATVNAAPPDPLPRAQPEDVGLSSARLERITAVLKSYADNGKVAGSVALVARRGKLVYFEAAGQRDREAHSPMRTDSIFRIASQSKAIVSVGAMMLVEQGK